MIDVIDPNDESRIRYRARRRGFQFVRTRGREHRRRLACGQGDLMLLDADKVVLFAATLEEVAMFLKADDKAKKHRRECRVRDRAAEKIERLLERAVILFVRRHVGHCEPDSSAPSALR